MLQPPRRCDTLNDRNAQPRIRVGTQEAEPRICTGGPFEPRKEVEEPQAPLFGPSIQSRRARKTGVERIHAAARIGSHLVGLIQSGKHGRRQLADSRDRRAGTRGWPVRTTGVSQVVVGQLVTEGKRHDLVEYLVGARDAPRVEPNLDGDPPTGSMALPPSFETSRGATTET